MYTYDHNTGKRVVEVPDNEGKVIWKLKSLFLYARTREDFIKTAFHVGLIMDGKI